jgi:hypothetical protein
LSTAVTTLRSRCAWRGGSSTSSRSWPSPTVPLAVAQHREEVRVDARPRKRRRDDVGERGDAAVRDRVGDLLGDPGVEDRDQQRHVLVDVTHQQRDPQREGVVARGDADHVRALVLERLAERLVVGVVEPGQLGAGSVERLADLLGEVATTHEQHAPTLGHARDPTSP